MRDSVNIEAVGLVAEGLQELRDQVVFVGPEDLLHLHPMTTTDDSAVTMRNSSNVCATALARTFPDHCTT
jgi:hypothetical protein